MSFQFGRQRVEGRTSNVSRGGLCANVASALPNGSDVIIDIVLVFDEDTVSEPLRLTARVCWCTPLDHGYQVGVTFRGLDQAKLEYLTLFLKYLDDGQQRERAFKKAKNVDDRFD